MQRVQKREIVTWPSDATCLYVKLRVKWTCGIQSGVLPISDTGGTRQFASSKWAVENINFYRGLLIKSVRTSHLGEYLCWVLRVKKYCLYALVTTVTIHDHDWHRCTVCTPTQYVVNTLYWPHTALSVYRVCYFLVPHTHVLCMGSGSATGKKIQVRLVHSLLKYFFKFQLWYWIKNLHYQIFKFVIDNSDISLNCLQHIQKRRNFDAKVTCHQPICLVLHAILSGVGVHDWMDSIRDYGRDFHFSPHKMQYMGLNIYLPFRNIDGRDSGSRLLIE